MHPIRLVVALALCGISPAWCQPVVQSVVNGASFEAFVSPGCLVSIFGSRLAHSTVATTTMPPLPTRLENTTVLIGGIEAPLYFVSPNQINAQIPYEVMDTSVPLKVKTAEGTSLSYMVTVTPTSPAIFTKAANGKGPALYFDGRFRLLNIVHPDDTIIFYATGLGATNPPVRTGMGGNYAEPLNRVVDVPEVYIGEEKVRVAYAGVAPFYAGVYQVNVVVPAAPATDRIFLRDRTRQSNIAQVAIPAGNNVSAVTGTIAASYPVSGSVATYSAQLVAGQFSARFTIQPQASPFKLAAVSDAGSSVVTFDPATASFSAAVTTPIDAARYGDFSRCLPEMRLVSFMDGNPMPGNIVPASLIDAEAMRAIRLLPAPSEPGNCSTGVFRATGAAKAGLTFVVDQNNNAGLSAFGGFLEIPLASFLRSRSVNYQLYIDGRVVASAEAEFQLKMPSQFETRLMITSMTPQQAPRNQSSTLTVAGVNFQPGFSAVIQTPFGTQSVAPEALKFVSPEQVQVNVMLGSPQSNFEFYATLKITNPDGDEASKEFQVVLPPLSSGGTVFNYVYKFGESIPSNERDLIRTAIYTGYQFLTGSGLGDPGNTTVLAYSTLDEITTADAQWFAMSEDDARKFWQTETAAADINAIFIYTSSSGWISASSGAKAEIVIHQLVHELQWKLSQGRLLRFGSDQSPSSDAPLGGPRWLIEGAAEYLGYRGAGEGGLLDLASARAAQMQQSRMTHMGLYSLEPSIRFDAPPPLERSAVYALAFSGVDYLVYSLPIVRLTQFWTGIGQHMEWHDAFQASFGKDIQTFYASFEDYRIANMRPFPELSGSVEQASSRPFAGIHVYSCLLSSSACTHAVTDTQGFFSMVLPNGIYRVQFGRTNDVHAPDGYYKQSYSGFTKDVNSATPVAIDVLDVGLLVAMPF